MAENPSRECGRGWARRGSARVYLADVAPENSLVTRGLEPTLAPAEYNFTSEAPVLRHDWTTLLPLTQQMLDDDETLTRDEAASEPAPVSLRRGRSPQARHVPEAQECHGCVSSIQRPDHQLTTSAHIAAANPDKREQAAEYNACHRFFDSEKWDTDEWDLLSELLKKHNGDMDLIVIDPQARELVQHRGLLNLQAKARHKNVPIHRLQVWRRTDQDSKYHEAILEGLRRVRDNSVSMSEAVMDVAAALQVSPYTIHNSMQKSGSNDLPHISGVLPN